MRNLTFICLLVLLFGCNKPNPTPEVTDEIYLDLKNRATEAKRALDIEKKKLEGYKNDLAATTPQAGSIKFIQKRYFETESAIEKLGQENKYYEIAMESRKIEFRKRYLATFSEGTSPISSEEVESYKISRRNNIGNTTWNSKDREKKYESRQGPFSSEKKK